MIEQLAGNSCVLAEDLIGGSERRQGAKGNVAKVADRRSGNVQAGADLFRLEEVAAYAIAARGLWRLRHGR